MNYHPKCRNITPLGVFFSHFDFSSTVVYVHYNDYHKCDVEQIRQRVINQGRNWDEFPPITLSDWRDFGEYRFFIPGDTPWKDSIFMNLDKSFPQNCFDIGIPYFRFYRCGDRYLYYALFLAKNGYKPLILKEGTYLNPKYLANNTSFVCKEDIFTAYELLKLSNESIIDKDGGIYVQTDEDLQLLFLPPRIKVYNVDRRTSVISINAFSLCCETLELISFGQNIKHVRWDSKRIGLNECTKLKHIIIPPQNLEEYRKIFPKKSLLLFCDYQFRTLKVSAVYNDSILEWVPYTEKFIIPEGVTDVSSLAFSESDVRCDCLN